MNTPTLSLIAVTFLTITNATEAEPSKPNILHKLKVDKLEVELIQSPEFDVAGPKDKQPRLNKNWLEIEAKINLETISKDRFIPEFTATFHIAYRNSEGRPSQLVTPVSYTNINTDSGATWVVAYLHPDTLVKITGKKRPKPSDLLAIAVTVDAPAMSKSQPQDTVQQVVYHSNKKLSNWWDNSTITPVKNQILLREQTPFEHLWSDRYPMTKKATTLAR